MNKLRINRKLITAAACSVQPAGLGHRAGVPRRPSRPGTVCLLAVAAAWLAALGVPGVSQSAVLASSPGLTWTEQHPATHPPARWGASMAYDAATGNIVLFGGHGPHGRLDDTWTWDGSTWAKQAPAAHPSARWFASMAYDAATGDIVLFGGEGNKSVNLSDTWTWDGSTWAKQAPAAHPSARQGASMDYDAATGKVVLFGGYHNSGRFMLGDTWTWDGSTWTKQAPAAHPLARRGASMAYDAATGNIVLFSGEGFASYLGDTWTWDGSTWTQQAPAASPSAREFAPMAYDAATGNIVLFGGGVFESNVGDTWTWDGSTWTKQAPVASPSARQGASMAYDAATRNIVLFGGHGHFGCPCSGYLAGTWTWGGPG